MDRRKFIRNSAASIAAFSIIPSHVMGRNGALAPSDQLTRAIIGVGGMGQGHIRYPGARLTAICDVDSNHLKTALEKCPQGTKAVHDYRELLTDPGIDIIHIATPPHWHGIMSVDAARAGKDVWCEKPMTRTIGEGLRVKEAMAQHGRMFRLNTWFRFKDNFYGMGTTVEPIKKLVQSGIAGMAIKSNRKCRHRIRLEILLGRPHQTSMYNQFRLNSITKCGWDQPPSNLTIRTGFTAPSGVTGTMTGADWVTWVSITSTRSSISWEKTTPVRSGLMWMPAQQHPDAAGTWNRIELTYDDGCRIILDGENRDTQAAYLEGPNGKLFPGFRSTIPDLEKKLAAFPDPEPQITDFSESVRTRRKFALNEENGFRSCTMVNMAIIAVRLGRTLHFDPVKLEFTGDEAANMLMNQPMRAPWTI